MWVRRLDQIKLGPFAIRDTIGRGGTGVIYSAIHLRQQIEVAVKVITSPRRRRPSARAWFRREVQAVAALDHPGIITIFDYGEVPTSVEDVGDDALSPGAPYYVMEFARHGTLREQIGQMSFARVQSYLLTLLDALAHAHAVGVIHRDIKPQNILLDAWQGQIIAKLADFGLAHSLERADESSQFVGTPGYMPPEQINKPWHTHGPWSDLYSLGCVAFEMVTGKPLFKGMNVSKLYKQQTGAPLPRVDRYAEVPDGFQQWLDGMVAPEPSARFQTAADAARALAAIEPRAVGPGTRAWVTPMLEPILRTPEAGALPLEWPEPAEITRPARFIGAGLSLYRLREVPLVGRQDELEVLWQALRRVSQQGRAEVVVVHGDQGCGKSRLLEGFTRRLAQLGAATVLQTTCSRHSGPGEALSAMLTRHLGGLHEDHIVARGAEAEPASEAGVLDAHDAQVLKRLVNPPDRAVPPDAAAQRWAAIRRYLIALARQRPVVVWIDDAHFDTDALEFVKFMATRWPEQAGSVLIVAAVTDDTLADMAAERRLVEALEAQEVVEALSVDLIAPVDHERLVTQLLPLDGDLARQVAWKTAGNPLFAVELVGDWVEQDMLAVGERGFVLRDGVRAVIPDRLHQVWVRRLEALVEDFSPQARLALELAAALGLQVDAREWSTVCALASVEIDERLVDEIIARGFARRTDRGWVFVHAILRESLARLAREAGRWQAHMSCCAAAIEQLYDLEQPAPAGRFGHYVMDAGEYERALEPLWRAVSAHQLSGDLRSSGRFAIEYEQCLEALEVPSSDVWWGMVWFKLAEARVSARDMGVAAELIERVATAAREYAWTELRAQSVLLLGACRLWMSVPGAAELIHEGCALLEELPPERRMRGLFLVAPHALTSLGEFDEAERLIIQGLDEARARSDSDLRGQLLLKFVRVHFFRRDWAAALDYCEQAKQVFLWEDNWALVADCLEYEAEIYRVTGYLSRAEKLFRKCIAMLDRVGRDSSISRANLAAILLDEDRAQEADLLYATASDGFRRTGRRLYHALAKSGLVACAAHQHEWGIVDEHLSVVEEILSKSQRAERDIAEVLEVAADKMVGAGRAALARRATRLAAQQWRRLGEEHRATQVEARLVAHCP